MIDNSFHKPIYTRIQGFKSNGLTTITKNGLSINWAKYIKIYILIGLYLYEMKFCAGCVCYTLGF